MHTTLVLFYLFKKSNPVPNNSTLTAIHLMNKYYNNVRPLTLEKSHPHVLGENLRFCFLIIVLVSDVMYKCKCKMVTIQRWEKKVLPVNSMTSFRCFGAGLSAFPLLTYNVPNKHLATHALTHLITCLKMITETVTHIGILVSIWLGRQLHACIMHEQNIQNTTANDSDTISTISVTLQTRP